MSDDLFPIDRAHPPREIRYRGAPLDFFIRPWDVDDIEARLALIRASMSELRPFMPWVHAPVTAESQYQNTRRWQTAYWEGREFVFGVFGKDGAPMGGAGLHPRTPLNPAALEVGYWCGTPFAGKGLTTHVVRCLVVLAFEWFGVDRMQLGHATTNDRSRRVAEKCGFRLEGIVRRSIPEPSQTLRDGGFIASTDTVSYGLVKEDLATLEWLEETRAKMTLVDVLGKEHAAKRG